mmetsp:Transcript_38793/g.113468  ORF Transcript_38793/g.113468 Transcript_38793/m.113468 type:complete len:177 (+) Transcript_38793:105-635(+)
MRASVVPPTLSHASEPLTLHVCACREGRAATRVETSLHTKLARGAANVTRNPHTPKTDVIMSSPWSLIRSLIEPPTLLLVSRARVLHFMCGAFSATSGAQNRIEIAVAGSVFVEIDKDNLLDVALVLPKVVEPRHAAPRQRALTRCRTQQRTHRVASLYREGVVCSFCFAKGTTSD